MSFINNFVAGAKIIFARIKTKLFWTNFLKVAIPFFIVVTLVSLLLNNSSDIFAGDFAKVIEVNFSEEKWKKFLGIKLVISFIYGFYVTNKNTK